MVPPSRVPKYPSWQVFLRELSVCISGQDLRPVAEAGVVLELLDTFGQWAEDALDQVVPERSAIDGQER